jgi:glycosyltransferase involved in cell wall biosynthesis
LTERILYLIESLGVGGVERGLVLDLRFLDRERFDPEVAVLRGPTTLAPEIERMEIPIHRLKATPGLRSLFSVPRIVRLIREGHFELIYTALAWPALVGAIAGRVAKVRVVSHVTNADPAGWKDRELPRPLLRKTRTVAAVNALVGRFCVDRYVAVSEAAFRSARWRSMRDVRKVTVVLRGQDLEELDRLAALEPAAPFPEFGEPTVLAVGRLYRQKGHRFLVEAFAQIAAEYPRARLLFAGEGPEHELLQRLVDDLGMQDRVEFLGIRRDVPALLARADVFAFPSLWEGQGNALIEAMALGRPIVATRIPAIEAAVEDEESGFLVPAADVKALAGAILALAQEPDRAAAMGARARLAVRDRFDIRKTTQELERVYEDLLLGEDGRQ